MGRSFQSLPDDLQSILQASDRKTKPLASKLLCALGPSSSDVETIKGLLRGGMKVARFDFSWGTAEQHQQAMDNLRTAMEATDLPCAVALDGVGREIKVLNMPASPIELKEGSTVVLTLDKSAKASSSLLPLSSLTTFEGLGIGAGHKVTIGKSLYSPEAKLGALAITDLTATSATCVVRQDATLAASTALMVNIQGVINPEPCLVDKAVNPVVTWGVKNKIDFVMLTAVRSRQDVEAARAMLDSCGLTDTLIISKIECLAGIKAYQEVIDASDAIIYCRGQVGHFLDPEKVFSAQKFLLRAANMAGKPVYVSRVMDSMADAPRPTRAEATDVANLVLDGADGILMGAEVFRGMYPVEAVETLSGICHAAEGCFDSTSFYQMVMEEKQAFSLAPELDRKTAMASAAIRAADKMQARLIVVFTVTGTTARSMCNFKPRQPILTVVCKSTEAAMYTEERNMSTDHPPAMSHSPSISDFGLASGSQGTVLRQCLMYRGVIPIMASPDKTDSIEILNDALGYAKSKGLLSTGDRIVVTKCPRKGAFDVMEETGVVSMVTVE